MSIKFGDFAPKMLTNLWLETNLTKSKERMQSICGGQFIEWIVKKAPYVKGDDC